MTQVRNSKALNTQLGERFDSSALKPIWIPQLIILKDKKTYMNYQSLHLYNPLSLFTLVVCLSFLSWKIPNFQFTLIHYGVKCKIENDGEVKWTIPKYKG